MTDPISLAATLRDRCEAMRFTGLTVYNPLVYAWAAHEEYLRRFAMGPKKVLFLGMNPGPFGMAQIGVPFGEIAAARDWMHLSGAIGKPPREHPKRPIQGWACTRSEVSGRRLWGLFAARFGTAGAFFEHHLVVNWCPLVFMGDSGANITPDKLPAAELQPLEQACDAHLTGVIRATGAAVVVGIGKIASAAATRAGAPRVVDVLHPSPASPAANRGWAEAATRSLVAAGVWTTGSQ
jgi:single-strand selective monofunctional uracil DNA glycosylase